MSAKILKIEPDEQLRVWATEFLPACRDFSLRYAARLNGRLGLLTVAEELYSDYLGNLRKLSIGFFVLIVLASALAQVKKRRNDVTTEWLMSNIQNRDIYYEIISGAFGAAAVTGWSSSDGVRAVKTWTGDRNYKSVHDVEKMKRFIGKMLGPATFYRMLIDVGLASNFLQQSVTRTEDRGPVVLYRLSADK